MTRCWACDRITSGCHDHLVCVRTLWARRVRLQKSIVVYYSGLRVDIERRERFSLYFFFQAEDGIRDYKVTGVQTCALPISDAGTPTLGWLHRCPAAGIARRQPPAANRAPHESRTISSQPSRTSRATMSGREIGRASCRERV